MSFLVPRTSAAMTANASKKDWGLGDSKGSGLPRQAVNIADGLAGGLPYQPWAAALMKERAATPGRDDPHTKCLPPNFPRAYALPHIQKFIQTPGLVVILDEFNASYRQIFTDGAPAAGGSAAFLERLLFREMGRRHAGGRDHRIPRRPVARPARATR